MAIRIMSGLPAAGISLRAQVGSELAVRVHLPHFQDGQSSQPPTDVQGTLREHGPVNTKDNHARAAQLLTPESPPLEPLGWVWAQRTVS